MGLSASQARFLGLTARKSNVEYQGQQINQARTALSNQVMGLYEKYNNLKVPVPPSVNDFVKTTYTLDSTYENYQIDSFSKITSGQYEGYYDVNLKYTDSVPQAYSHMFKNVIGTCEKNADDYTKLTLTIGTDVYQYDKDNIEASTITKILEQDVDLYPELKTIIDADKLKPNEPSYYMYNKNGVNYYTSYSELNYAFEGGANFNKDYTFEYEGKQNIDKTIPAIAALSQEASGRISAIHIEVCQDDESLEGNTYSVTTGEEDDEKAYQDAMNKYYYDKAKYENEVQRINKETEKIQTQDKSLELKLNQLDTEQKAIATEIDSVTKVIEKTIDSVFKTYSS